MRPNDPRCGFSLIEVLAALVITAAFCAVVLPFGARLAGRWWWGETRVETADAWMQAIARLSDDLGQTVPIVVQTGDTTVTSFVAAPDALQFVRPAPASAPRSGLQTVVFEIRADGSGDTLVRRAGAFRPGAARSDLGPPATILSGPFHLRFRAFGEDRVPREAWDNVSKMPVGVELSAVASRAGVVPPGPILLHIVAKSPSTKPSSVSDPPRP